MIALSIDEDTIEEVQEIVTGCAVRTPIAWKLFGAGQDFFRHHVSFGKSVKVCLWIEQTVDVINTQARDLTCGDHIENILMRRLKDVVAFGSHCDQIADIEKSPVIDPVCRLTPECQPVMLAGQ